MMEEEKSKVSEEKKEDKESKKEKEVSGKDENLTEKMRENPWMLSTFVLGVVVLILLVSNFSGGSGGMVGNTISSDDAGEMLLSFYESQGAEGLVLDSVEESNGLYKVNFGYQGQVVPMYLTKDGELAGNLAPISGAPTGQDSQTEQEPQEVPKSDKPVVELFVMTHCPYGTQAEKGIIPTIETLGDTIDAEIKFVHYFMHDPEETETLIQVCIREEQPSKFYDYLECFLEDGDSDRCLTETKIDKTKVDSCISSGKSDEYYDEDSALSEGYGVGGSPTLVVNGEIVQSGRSADAYLTTICNAFNTAPEICGTADLDSTSPSPGFGYDEGTDTAAQC